MSAAAPELDVGPLLAAPRWTHEVVLRPLQGVRFQPTGFPDIGPALFTDPDGQARLLVESQQSMANHLEATCWDAVAEELRAPFRGLSHVRVLDPEGSFLTSSVLEPHRLASPVVLADGSVADRLRARLARGDSGLDPRKLPFEVFALDAGSLVHGVFLQSVAGHLRIPRALSAFVEAIDVRLAASGGALLERGSRAGRGKGQVVFHREEFVAREIRAFFKLDVAAVRGFGLAPEETELVLVLALLETRCLLDDPLRLRTRCDLRAEGEGSSSPASFVLPSRARLEAELARLVGACARLETSEVRTR